MLQCRSCIVISVWRQSNLPEGLAVLRGSERNNGRQDAVDTQGNMGT